MLDGQHGGIAAIVAEFCTPAIRACSKPPSFVVRLVLIHLLLRRHRYLDERTGIFDTEQGDARS